MWRWVQRNSLALFGAALLFAIDLGLSSLATCVGGEPQQAQKCAEEYYGFTQAISVGLALWLIGGIRGEYNLVTAISTIVIAIFTITLWRATTGLLMAARDQSRIAARAARAAWDAATAAERQVHIAIDTAKAAQQAADHIPRVERAYLFVEIENHGIGATRTYFRWTFHNYGKTPAILETFDIRCLLNDEFSADNLTHIPNLPIPPDEKVVLPGKTFFGSVDAEYTPPDLEKFREGKFAFWVVGSLVYQDLFGIEHVTRFRWRLGKGGKCLPFGVAPHNERT